MEKGHHLLIDCRNVPRNVCLDDGKMLDVMARSAAKAGMHGFTKALALEMARHGVTVNTVSPGYLRTKMVEAVPAEVMNGMILPQIPMGRLGEPDEIAGLVAYLVSEDAGFMTGANLAINGGQHMY